MKNRKKRRLRKLKAFKENVRWRFWGYMMDNFPRFYAWADKHLPFDTLPF